MNELTSITFPQTIFVQLLSRRWKIALTEEVCFDCIEAVLKTTRFPSVSEYEWNEMKTQQEAYTWVIYKIKYKTSLMNDKIISENTNIVNWKMYSPVCCSEKAERKPNITPLLKWVCSISSTAKTAENNKFITKYMCRELTKKKTSRRRNTTSASTVSTTQKHYVCFRKAKSICKEF